MRAAYIVLPCLLLGTGCMADVLEPGVAPLSRPDRALPGYCSSVATDAAGVVLGKGRLEWEPLGATWRKHLDRWDSAPGGLPPASTHPRARRDLTGIRPGGSPYPW
jgi:hypothetical protein